MGDRFHFALGAQILSITTTAADNTPSWHRSSTLARSRLAETRLVYFYSPLTYFAPLIMISEIRGPHGAVCFFFIANTKTLSMRLPRQVTPATYHATVGN